MWCLCSFPVVSSRPSVSFPFQTRSVKRRKIDQKRRTEGRIQCLQTLLPSPPLTPPRAHRRLTVSNSTVSIKRHNNNKQQQNKKKRKRNETTRRTRETAGGSSLQRSSTQPLARRTGERGRETGNTQKTKRQKSLSSKIISPNS